jgi:serine/threonine-protein kinase
MSADIPRVSSLIPDIDAELDAIVAKALEKGAQNRYQTAQEMRNALESYITRTGKLVRQEEIGQRLNEMFQETRQHVSRQIQMHMGAVGSATNTGELMALNLDSLKRFDPSAPPSGVSGRQLLELGGSESGSGSGVVSAANPDQAPQSMLRPAPKRSRGAFIALGAAVLIAGAALFMRCSKTDLGMKATAPVEPSTTATAGNAANAPSAAATGLAPAPPVTLATSESAATAPATATGIAPPPDKGAEKSATTSSHKARVVHAPAAPQPAPKPAPPAATAAPAPDEGTGFVTLDTYPWTKVSEGSRVLGVTPLIRVALPAGVHTLTLENVDQGIKQTYPVTIKAGETVSRRLGLK